MDALTEGFAARIKGRRLLCARVHAVELTEQGILLRWEHEGREQAEEFDYAVCAIPATAVLNIRFSHPLPEAQAQALLNLTYSNAAKSLCHVSKRFWELEDGIFGGVSLTDDLCQQCWYPSDNAHADFNVSQEPAALTAGYRWEETAGRFSAVAPGQRDEVTLHHLFGLHPGQHAAVGEVVHALWDEAVQEGSGAYAFFRPGERESMQEALRAAFPKEQPRVFFAGEHLAFTHASIQGAIQTALAAAQAVAAAIPR
jgi:monoamine oxidase